MEALDCIGLVFNDLELVQHTVLFEVRLGVDKAGFTSNTTLGVKGLGCWPFRLGLYISLLLRFYGYWCLPNWLRFLIRLLRMERRRDARGRRFIATARNFAGITAIQCSAHKGVEIGGCEHIVRVIRPDSLALQQSSGALCWHFQVLWILHRILHQLDFLYR